MANDWTVINVTNDNIELKPNRFSGDNIVSPENVKPGDKIYTYGATSGMSEGVVFGEVVQSGDGWLASDGGVGSVVIVVM